MKFFAKIRFFFLFSIVCVGFFSCDPNEKLPPETFLEYVGTQQIGDSSGITGIVIQVNFQDGDKNIGALDSSNNVFVAPFDKLETGDYQAFQTTDVEPKDVIFEFSMPDPDEPNSPSIKGLLDINIQGANFDFMKLFSKQGIVRFEIWMIDRDSVPSNIIVTPDISIR